MHVSDDLYTGPVGGPNAFSLVSTTGFIYGNSGLPVATGWPADGTPTNQYGVGPLGRVVFRNIQPLALATANLAVLQAPTAGTALTLVAGTGIQTAVNPLNGQVLYVLDVPRCISLTSSANLSGITFLVTMIDEYGQTATQLVTGPNNNTVVVKKACIGVLSIVPQGTSASTVSVGTSDTYGLPFRCIDAGYIVSVKWAGVLAQNAGTLTVADQTSPATNLTGDPRGTYAINGAASNGANRLVIALTVDASQCGPFATRVNAIGVTPA